MKNKKPTLLLDTCVVSDFIEVDAEIIRLATKCFGRLHIPNVLMDELTKRFSYDALDALELLVINVSEELVDDAILFRSKEGMSRLSVYDCVCFLTAQKYSYTCVTNDLRLQNICKKRGVQVWWGLEIVLKLYDLDAISFQRAESFGIRLNERSPYFKKELLEKFQRRLLELKDKE